MSDCELIWRMWYGHERLRLNWPDTWDVHVRGMADASEADDAAVARAVAMPVDGMPLSQLARGRSSCCILVDDLTRPTPAARVLPHLLRALVDAGMSQKDIFFIVANGTHRALTRADLLKKVGPDVLAKYSIMRHDCHQNLVKVTEIDGVGPVQVNRFFYEADLKLAVTGLMPHFMSGFSGGAKIVMPAVCAFDTIAATHSHTVMGPPAAVGVAEGNAMRRVMERCAQAAGLAFTANCVFNSAGQLAAVYCGGSRAYMLAVQRAREVYATEVGRGAEIGVFNAFPKDTEFIQAMAALNVWAERDNPARDLVRPGGSIVVICAATEGLGAHQLIERGRLQFRRRDQHGSFRRMLQGRNLLFLAPGVAPTTVKEYYQPEARHFQSWQDLRACLERLHPHGARVDVYPAASLQTDAEFISERLLAKGEL